MEIAGVPIVEAVRLQLQPGDIVVLKVAPRVTAHEHNFINEYMAELLPEGVKFLLLSGDMDISVITPPAP